LQFVPDKQASASFTGCSWPDVHIFYNISWKRKKIKKDFYQFVVLMDGSIAVGKNAENICQTGDIPGHKNAGTKKSAKKGGHLG